MKTLLTLLFVLLATPLFAQNGRFIERFENPGSGLNYGFAGKVLPVIPSGRIITHLPNGGPDGSGAVQIEVLGCTTDCSTSTNQGNIGYITPPIGGTWPMGAKIYVFFRHYLESTVGGGAQKLFILPAPTSGSRIMIHKDRAYGTNAGCHFSGEGNDFYHANFPTNGFAPIPPNTWLRASEFGLPFSFTSLAPSTMPGRSHYATMSGRVNISWDCAAVALVANTTAVGPVKPQMNSALSPNGWNDFVYEFTSGPAGTVDIRYWVNNNDFNNPTGQAFNVASAVDPSRWGTDGIHVGGYWGMGEPHSTKFRFDDVGFDSVFPVGFHRTSGQTPPPPPPPPVPELSLVCPTVTPIQLTTGTSTAVTFSPTVSGGVAPINLVSTPASGSTFNVGNTTVTTTATDAANQVKTCTFTVSVIAPLPPPVPPPARCTWINMTVVPNVTFSAVIGESIRVQRIVHTADNNNHHAAVALFKDSLTNAGFDVLWTKDGGWSYFLPTCRRPQ